MKKLLPIAAALVLLVTGTVTAAEGTDTQSGFVTAEYKPSEESYFCHEALNQGNAALLEDDAYSEGFEKLLSGLKSASEKIVFDNDDFCFTITEENYDKLGNFNAVQFQILCDGFMDKHPELFYVKKECGYSLYLKSGNYYISSFSPTYSMEKSEITEAVTEFEALTDEIAEYVTENAETDLDKALLLHDYIVLNYEYDTSLEIHDAYRFITEGKGVCESYAGLFRYVSGKCGVEVKYASSREMAHVWNLVRLDGKWYHADVTWDDRTPDLHARVHHDNFLVSDEDFSNPELFTNIHYGFTNEDGVVCEETYADAFWGINASENSLGYKISDGSPIVFDDDNYYFNAFNESNNTSAVIAHSRTTHNESTVTESGIYWDVPNADWYYPSNYSGLSLIDGVIIYSTPREVRYVLPDGNHNTLIAKISDEDAASGRIYGFVTSLDGKEGIKEPYYTHIAPEGHTKDNDKFSRHYKDGKDIYNVEIDYFVAHDPNTAEMTERDVTVHVAFDDIHTVVEETLRKPTYITKGKKHRYCTGCDTVDESITVSPYCTQGENGHEPNISDLVNIIKCTIGKGQHYADTNTEHLQNDTDNDGKFSLHDLNEIFRYIKDDLAGSED